GGMTGASTAVGDDGGGALHDRLPVRVGHVRVEHVAGLDAVHVGNGIDVAHRAGADALADGAAFDQHALAVGVDAVAFVAAAAIALHRFRACLQDVELARFAVLAPLDVHGAA